MLLDDKFVIDDDSGCHGGVQKEQKARGCLPLALYCKDLAAHHPMVKVLACKCRPSGTARRYACRGRVHMVK